MYLTVSDIRDYFRGQLAKEKFTTDRNGGKTIEMIGASFRADEPAIFGTVNQEYVDAELKWYESESLNINDIYGEEKAPPQAWIMTADPHGNINSNYGNLIYSPKHFRQYVHAVAELCNNPDSRRASMIYTRPSIWEEYNENGKSDFICTNAVTYYIRDGKVHCVVQMRSNDAWAGYRNDYAWQRYVLEKVTNYINRQNATTSETFGPILTAGDIYWQCQNLHMYERNFYLIDHYNKTDEISISKSDYDKLYK